MKENLFVSFSSGYSSAMMASIIKEKYSDKYNIIFGMANTSKENEDSLIFADKCDKYFDLNLVWIEADINPDDGKGTRHIVKTFDTLTRDGSLFEKGIKKYGIPSVVNKWCNRELKLNAIHSYLKSIGWGNFGQYKTAIGIRADEIDRISSNKEKFNLWYPLVEMGISKRDRNRFWDNMPFKLNIKGYEGNCDMCFEKTNRKLCTIYKESPNKIDWWLGMEDKYSDKKIEGKETYNSFIDTDGGHYSLRNNKSYKDIIILAKQPFKKASDEYVYESDLFDMAGNCDGGCNIF